MSYENKRLHRKCWTTILSMNKIFKVIHRIRRIMCRDGSQRPASSRQPKEEEY